MNLSYGPRLLGVSSARARAVQPPPDAPQSFFPPWTLARIARVCVVAGGLTGALAFALASMGCGGADSARFIGSDGSVGFSDASSVNDAGVGAFTLVAPGVSGTTTLVPGEVLAVSIRIADPFGAGLEGMRVDFALLGQSMDASLSALFATTDSDGTVQIYLRAGQKPASFQLRITYGGTISYVPVVVEQTTQSSLALTVEPTLAPYLTGVSVTAYAARTCATIEDVPPSATVEFASSTATANLAGLSSGTSYAIVATALDVDGYTTYAMCVDVADPALLTELLLDFGIGKSADPTMP